MTNPNLKGSKVTLKEKQARAEDIADKLSNNNLWKSHGRPINFECLEKDLKLKIEDYGNMVKRSNLIRSYYELLSDYVIKNGFRIFVQTRNFI